MMMVFYTPKYVGDFWYQFECKFLKLFLKLPNCASVGEKKTLIITKKHARTYGIYLQNIHDVIINSNGNIP
jgi:hypothetical protein